MKIIIKATGIELTPAIEKYVNEKIGSLEKYLKRLDDDAIIARVEVGKTTEHHNKGKIFRAEVNLSLPCVLLRAEEIHDDLYAAIDLVSDETKRQIVDFKDKKITKIVRKAMKTEE